MKKFIVFLSTLLLISGCVVMDRESKEELKEGVIDACYVVLEFNPVDCDIRINKYLNAKERNNIISKEERKMLESCLKRTRMSMKWRTEN